MNGYRSGRFSSLRVPQDFWLMANDAICLAKGRWRIVA
jgi:hypothetical protein